MERFAGKSVVAPGLLKWHELREYHRAQHIVKTLLIHSRGARQRYSTLSTSLSSGKVFIEI